MDFYNISADGYSKPLTKMQIAGLFHAGLFGTDQLCKQVDEKEWRTIDEMFPLLRYEIPKRSLYQPADVHGSEARHPALAILISILVISAVSLGGYFAFRVGIEWSENAKAVTDPSAPVANTIVSATPLTDLPQPDVYSQQAGSTQLRLDEEKSAREKRSTSLKNASTQSRKSAKNKRRPEGL